MSLFDYPRINFAGTIQLNPGTANNDDYAQQPNALVIPQSFPPPYAGQVFGLIDSKMVQARTFGMSDPDFVAWVQKAQTFDISGSSGQTQQVPAEWNYYGDMSSQSLAIKVVGVQSGPDAKADSGASSVIGATINYSGNITDVNSEGSPPATQFFLHRLLVRSSGGGAPLLSGAASKGACQWLNFYRNINLQQDGGAGGYVYHVMRKSAPGTSIKLPGFDDPAIVGVICRYYLYNFQTADADLETLYQQQKTNPATLQIVGTFAPLYRDETIITGPVGRLMVCDTANISTAPITNNNGRGKIALAPAVLRVKDNVISVDFSGTFPDNFQSGGNPAVTTNAKYDFGAVTLTVSNARDSAPVGPVEYTDTDGGNSRGWIFDFDIATDTPVNNAVRKILQDPAAKFSLVSDKYGTVLAESDYYFVTNQQGIYAEQNGPGDSFLNQGTYEPATLAVYHRGRELGAAECPPISVWQYRSVPMQCPGNAETIATDFKPGQPLKVDTSKPGNFLLTFAIGAPANYPPTSYNTFFMPPYITNAPSISLRILPNDEDFSGYYVDPSAAEPVGNTSLTFEVVYEKVLRTYYLLYPAMNVQAFPLNDEKQVTANAQGILQVTDPSPKNWMSAGFMPRTRDMSASRRTLLQAWCRKVLAGGSA